MSDAYDALANLVNPLRTQAEQLQRRYEDERTSVENDPRFSTAGKAEQVQTLRDRYKPQLSALRAREEAAIQSSITSIERSIFGTPAQDPSSIISFRDAQDRAERLDVDDADGAKTLLTRAERTGDRALADAVVRVAAERNWSSVIAQYDRSHPGTRDSLRSLSRIREAADEGFERSMSYGLF